MVYTDADLSPQRSQWEANSQYSQAFNCGPTGVTKVACFYKDRWFGIEATRKLVTWPGRPTTYEEQRRMLIARGVNASVRQVSSLAEMRNLNPTGRRPYLIGVNMYRVPPSYRGHSFTGWHTLVVLSAPSGGFWVMESNLPIGTTAARRWYPDWVMNYAFLAPSSSIAIVPYDPKVVVAPPAPAPRPTGFPSRGWVNAGINARRVSQTRPIHHTTKVAGNYTFLGSYMAPPPPGSASRSSRWLVYFDSAARIQLMFHSSVVKLA